MSTKPQYRLFELIEETSIEIAKQAFEGEPISEDIKQKIQLDTPQCQIFLGKCFFAATVHTYLARLTVSKDSYRYFAYVPNGYNGECTAPIKSREIENKKERELIEGVLSNGNFKDMFIVSMGMNKLTFIPDDFDCNSMPYFKPHQLILEENKIA